MLLKRNRVLKKIGPKKLANVFFRRILVKLGRVYTSLPSVNSVKLVKLSDFTRNRVYLRVNTILVPKNVSSVNLAS